MMIKIVETNRFKSKDCEERSRPGSKHRKSSLR
jgi:hypothetical protein